ncbi:MAG TPA: TA system VapC family ribonuclease toxin [Pirellulales bacterium]
MWTALAFDSHPNHRKAVEASTPFSADRPAVFCRATQQSFLRIATTPAVLRMYGAEPFTNRDALLMLDQFMALPSVTFRDEPQGVVAIWRQLAGLPTTAPKVWMDAYLAAFAIASDLELMTLDRDFRSFATQGLKLNLLTSA